MRQRITYIQKPSLPFHPSQTTLTRDSLYVESLDAAREERVTFSFDELPSELWQVLRQCHQLHIRWASERAFEAVSPLSSRISPGLHVFYSPVEAGRAKRDSEGSISHALTMSGFWSQAPGEQGWTETIGKHEGGTDKVEIGLLGAEPASEPEEIKVGGLLAVVGQDEELKPTLFSFPSRHHPLHEDATYSVTFPPPTGLHPTMTISIAPEALKEPPRRPDATCALHAYLTLPSKLFGDKYQLSTTDPLFLKSHNLASLRAVAGETDLEAPDWSISRWGSNWLLELASPSESDEVAEEWNITIPLHLRYLPPSESGYQPASVPWPVVFWACSAEDGTKMGVNPFDRINLGWEGLFGPRTMFYQLHPSPSPEGGNLVEELEVPVLTLKENSGIFNSQVIELGTFAVISIGFLWVLWKLGLVARSSGIRPQHQRNPGKRDKAE
ncbi:hypothetical protein AN2240.2 [Aspergillus nidulans FGSC A4]|nr:hypothetical protein AN2240.2 [Aspergillus nidulans FGSC A4]|eukprot:XP_659844.1 hypothetical protein AN2240.2 [Aspergillus nidulans FGSC A4]